MVKMGSFADNIMQLKYSHVKGDGTKETWEEIAARVTKHVMRAVHVSKDLKDTIQHLITERKFIPGGRYLFSSGRLYKQVQNCMLYKAEDSREGWADMLHKTSSALMTGAGIGVEYNDVRPEGRMIRKFGGTSSGPLALMQMINELGRQIRRGGAGRSAIWAGLNWKHADIMKFITIKNWSKEVRMLKETDFNFPATLDGTNISVLLDDLFFDAYNNEKHILHNQAHSVYWATIERMLKTGEPGFSIDVKQNAGETLRNACTEITSCDDSDVCNLSSINLARIESIAEMKTVVELATAFLLAGTVYSDVPTIKTDLIRTKNRRLGLGLMGIHEWLLLHGKPYGPDNDLDKLLGIYSMSTKYAHQYADQWELTRPVKTRAIAPSGSISIIAETTSGIEPVFCSAYKRRYLNGTTWHYQYVVDSVVQSLVEKGINPNSIEDAYALATTPEKRVAFQVHLQKFVDHGISSTINLPAWKNTFNNESNIEPFGNMLIKHLPYLRGITTYPDGARGGQPLTPVDYKTAIEQKDNVFIESADICDITKSGSCGN